MWWTIAYFIVFTALAWFWFRFLTNRYEAEITRLQQDQTTIETVTHTFETTLAEQRTLLSQLRTERDVKAEMIDTYINEIERLHNEVRHQKGRAAFAGYFERAKPWKSGHPLSDHPEIDTDWKIENWSFLGSPIDYIVWHYSTNKEDNLVAGKVVFLDVESR